MLSWKMEEQGSTALLIEGQRRVGKSTVVREFAQNEYESNIIIDFSICSQEIRDLFHDEVQLYPLARQAIKHLVADHRYDYIETGSLISIKKNVKDILIPSEEHKISMYPMDFEEFLWATGDNVTMPLLEQVFQSKKAVGDGAHRKVMRTLRLYMLIGGMPQAVDIYLKTNNFEKVDFIKRDILNLYEDDFYKIDATGRLSRLFNAIPAQLNQNSARYTVSSVIPHLRPGTSLELIAELIDSHTVIPAYHTSQPSSEMASYLDLTRYKLFLSDTGLFTTLMFKNKAFTENDIYKRLLNDKHSANLGYLYENLVAQMLATKGYELFFNTFKKDSSTKSYEVDFLISYQNKICPIEVKSSTYRTHSSFDYFCEKYSSSIVNKYILHTKDFKKDKDVLMLPVYMTQFL